MRVLLTGFQPFGDVDVNPSQRIVEHFQNESRPNLISLVLPTEYEASRQEIERAIQAYNPDAVIMLGVAQNRTTISLERVAINVDDAARPDNAGKIAEGEAIAPDGPAAYWTTLPLTALQTALAERGIPVSISNHAGAYVCNHVFYAARHALECAGKPIPCGFIHVPALAETNQQAVNGLPLAVMIEAVEVCLQTLSKA